MNPIKTGALLGALRREKGLTQQQLAETFGVSRRTVSRWETGSNLPDLDILIELADFFNVDLRELLDGERKGGAMEPELRRTALKVADYSSEEKKKWIGMLHRLFWAGTAAAVLDAALNALGFENGAAVSFCRGFTLGVLLTGLILTSRYGAKIRAFKQRLLHLEKTD